jgi:hypothetical protein
LLSLSDELCAQRAEERIGSTVDVLVDTIADGVIEGRAAHQAPEVDGSTTLVGGFDGAVLRPGDLVRAKVIRTEGVDLVAEPVTLVSAVVTTD